MQIHRLFALALCALPVLASSAAAEWNRRISDIRIVHPPGSPPGTWRVLADVAFDVNAGLPGSLSSDVALYMNGTPISVVHVPADPSAQVNNCPTACNPTPCLYLILNTIPTTGLCGAASIGCACYNVISVDLGPINTSSGTDLVVHVGPSVGSLPENDPSDDFLMRTVPENDPGTLTCTGDGTGTACPCANNGASGHGCSNSANPNGAHLYATGFTEASLVTGDDSVVLNVEDMPAGAPLLYFQGTNGGTVLPFGDGVLCTTGSLIRLRTKINVGGKSLFPEPGEPSLSSAGGITLGSGAVRYYQAYHRDAAPYCTSNTFNLSNGISLTWY